jgi:hypothetical protein
MAKPSTEYLGSTCAAAFISPPNTQNKAKNTEKKAPNTQNPTTVIYYQAAGHIYESRGTSSRTTYSATSIVAGNVRHHTPISVVVLKQKVRQMSERYSCEALMIYFADSPLLH